MSSGVDLSVHLTSATAKAIKAAGKTFVCRYLGTGSAAKDLLANEPALIHATGLNLVLIWEGNPTFGGYFSYAQGVQDATNAVARAKALGAPAGVAIYFTVDFDAQSGNMAAVSQYVSGLKAAIGGYKVGLYGSYRVVTYVKASNSIPYYWQTYAWSSGQRASFAQLYQYQNSVTVGGVDVDLDTSNGSPGWWAASGSSAPGVVGVVTSAISSHKSVLYFILGVGMIGVAARYAYKRYSQS